MKRSEMVDVVYDVLLEITGTPWLTRNCSEILEAVERAGMRPPRNSKHPSDDDRSPVYGWEEE